jgi:hypothetical protein
MLATCWTEWTSILSRTWLGSSLFKHQWIRALIHISVWLITIVGWSRMCPAPNGRLTSPHTKGVGLIVVTIVVCEVSPLGLPLALQASGTWPLSLLSWVGNRSKKPFPNLFKSSLVHTLIILRLTKVFRVRRCRQCHEPMLGHAKTPCG